MPSDRRDAFAGSIEASVPLLTRFLEGFDEDSRTRQAPGLPNHVCWILGHCAITMRRGTEKITGEPLPQRDFIVGSATGDAARFGTETISFGSRPADDPASYPSLARAREIFERAASDLAGAVRAAPDARLDEVITWGRAETTLGALLARLVFHNGTHAGQLTDLRRALGMAPVIR